jgi:hypothetical protein
LLAGAQRALAVEYGMRDWAELKREAVDLLDRPMTRASLEELLGAVDG